MKTTNGEDNREKKWDRLWPDTVQVDLCPSLLSTEPEPGGRETEQKAGKNQNSTGSKGEKGLQWQQEGKKEREFTFHQ